MPRYDLYETFTEGDHTFACYDVAEVGLVDDVAEMVRDFYVEPEELLSELRDACVGLGEVADDTELAALVDRVAAAVIPQMDTNVSPKVRHLQVPRNEIAEILAVDVMVQVHGAVVPATRVRNKEISRSPSRGLDVLALSDTPAPVSLVLSEVKASSSNASPPAVVGAASDSMRAETLKRLHSPDALIAELNWARKHVRPEHTIRVATALLVYARSDAPAPHVAPVLVRPPEKYTSADYGCFRDSPQDYDPSPVHFVVLRLPWTLEEFAQRVYERAESAA